MLFYIIKLVSLIRPDSFFFVSTEEPGNLISKIGS